MRHNNSYLNRFLKTCLDIADYYDSKGDKDSDYLGDEMTEEIGLGYRALTGYLRKGVKEVIDLQMNYHTACEQRNYHKSIEKHQEEYLLDVFGDAEPYSINDKDKQRIKEFVQSIFAGWDAAEKEDEENETDH